ncbi:hypothetical protein [Streptomyces sp. NPDC005302]|uniref:hypothetical protein n=1 Tax=Streptomyces sp. NPDC005302 TaxID=3154675 RepID=UPI00339F2CF4
MNQPDLPPSEGPEYTPCACRHIEPEHEPNAGACLSCDCEAYRPAVPIAVSPPATNQTELRDRIAEVLVTTSRADWPYTPGQEKWDHHKHGDQPGHTFSISCALCTGDVDRLAAVVLAVLPACSDPIECSHEAALGEARETNRRLNYRAQQLESELATYRRAVSQWQVSDRGTYIPLRTISAIAKAAGRDIEHPRWILHYQRVEQAEAAIERVRSYLASQTDAFPANYPVAVPAADVLANLDTAPAAGLRGEAGETQQDQTQGERHCSRCGDSLTDYTEDDLVWRTGDDRPYCSGECIVAAHRAAQKELFDAHPERIVGYKSKGGRLLRCLAHHPGNESVDSGDFYPVASDDLPDGGVCTICGTDVLSQPAVVAQPDKEPTP